MRLKNFLIVVKDIEKSKQFYHELFGLNTVVDGDETVILTDGLVLQKRESWSVYLGKEVISHSNSCVLYFEEADIEGFVANVERLYPSIEYVHKLETFEWGQQVVRFYDLDGNLIEVRTPM